MKINRKEFLLAAAGLFTAGCASNSGATREDGPVTEGGGRSPASGGWGFAGPGAVREEGGPVYEGGGPVREGGGPASPER